MLGIVEDKKVLPDVPVFFSDESNEAASVEYVPCEGSEKLMLLPQLQDSFLQLTPLRFCL